MKYLSTDRAALALRIATSSGVALATAPFSLTAALVLAVLAFFVSPQGFATMNASITEIGGSTKANIQSQTTGATVDGDEVISVHEIIAMAHQDNPFADNMVGGLNSGKPIAMNTDASRVIGTTIVIPTVERLGAPMRQGAALRNGFEEQRRTGDFTLKVDLGWFGVGIQNTAKAQTILGAAWDDITKEDLAIRLAKQQSDDTLIAFKHSATPDNTVYPAGKTLDTLGTGDTYSYSLVVKSGGLLRDIGAMPIDARSVSDQSPTNSTKIARHLQFTTDSNARPLKTDSAYLQALQFAKGRGDGNNLFTGEYSDVDNQILYAMQCIVHGGFGSIGCPLQPEGRLGIAIGASTDLSAGLIGGGTAAAAAATPYVNYWESFSRFLWTPINGVTITGNPTAISSPTTGVFSPRATYGYLAAVHASGTDAGKISLFRYTTNTVANGVTTENKITGLKRLAATSSADNLTSIGDMTYGTAPWTTTADGLGFLGITDGLSAVPVGSKIYEVNSKGVPLAFGLGLGARAAVCGYGRIPIDGGGFKTMAGRTKWTEPHNRAYADGLEVSWGVAPFQRPNGGLPNYCLTVFARKIDGFPYIS